MRASTLLVVFDSFSQNPVNSDFSSTRPPDNPDVPTLSLILHPLSLLPFPFSLLPFPLFSTPLGQVRGEHRLDIRTNPRRRAPVLIERPRQHRAIDHRL